MHAGIRGVPEEHPLPVFKFFPPHEPLGLFFTAFRDLSVNFNGTAVHCGKNQQFGGKTAIDASGKKRNNQQQYKNYGGESRTH
jgi:hypothetical protein